ncbi:cytochrome P450 [Kibdelosporangium philippinense]|uniref:Cytochrome P450 n=1 Tax=Kibdelosporangium philippinense TaxID=211113 RepID=A0ABS8ZVC1_9PSEU|nr:cytochrome P450 [Kibdelosporangium philippinense]MCE7010945.1 cytochrome P450 [Kibdelosporangium philippinense]
MTEPFTEVKLLAQRSDEHPFKLMPELIRIREERPLTPMIFPDGHEGWLATGYDEVRAVLRHPRFSNRYELQHVPIPGFTETPPPAQPGDMLGLDAPEHTRYRKLLTGKFTPRRMRLLTEQVEAYTAERLDAMEREGPTVDLMEVYARPIPALMICELLGVPYDDREHFQRLIDAMVFREGMSMADLSATWAETQQYIRALLAAKRKSPTDDVFSELTSSDLDDDELSGLGAFLLGAGMHTTSAVIGMGTFALLIHPDQFAALRDEPELTAGAIEELLRYTGIGPGAVRTALEDVEIEGVPIKAGQTVTMSMDAANRDPRRFADRPDELDLRRNASGHLTFIHGVHQCLGQHLARVELRTALPSLVRRFPTLRLAIPVQEVPMRTDGNIYDVTRLPVTWAGPSRGQ